MREKGSFHLHILYPFAVNSEQQTTIKVSCEYIKTVGKKKRTSPSLALNLTWSNSDTHQNTRIILRLNNSFQNLLGFDFGYFLVFWLFWLLVYSQVRDGFSLILIPPLSSMLNSHLSWAVSYLNVNHRRVEKKQKNTSEPQTRDGQPSFTKAWSMLCYNWPLEGLYHFVAAWRKKKIPGVFHVKEKQCCRPQAIYKYFSPPFPSHTYKFQCINLLIEPKAITPTMKHIMRIAFWIFTLCFCFQAKSFPIDLVDSNINLMRNHVKCVSYFRPNIGPCCLLFLPLVTYFFCFLLCI